MQTMLQSPVGFGGLARGQLGRRNRMCIPAMMPPRARASPLRLFAAVSLRDGRMLMGSRSRGGSCRRGVVAASAGPEDGSSFEEAEFEAVKVPPTEAEALLEPRPAAVPSSSEAVAEAEVDGQGGEGGGGAAAVVARGVGLLSGVMATVRSSKPVAMVGKLSIVSRKRTLSRLLKAATADPSNEELEAEYLIELAKQDPQAVIARLEAKQEIVGPAVVVEYIRALVATDAIYRHVDAKEPSAKTLPQMLEELKERAERNQLAPGTSMAAPLHVMMVDPTLGRKRGIVGFFRQLLYYMLFISAASLAWLMGSMALRRYLSGMQSASGMAPGSQMGAAAQYAPKEFKKEDVPEKNMRTFKDVKGCDEAKNELQEIVEFLKKPERFTRLGGRLPKGVLLTGPPGTGKTLLARAVAGEAGVPFFYRAGSEFEEMFVGVGSRRVRSLFQAAKKKAPCIVFIDEIDAIGGSRKQWESHTRKTLNQLLVEMDGFDANDGVIVLAATNLPETLDAALTRPGRFDRHVAVPNPDLRGRTEILTHYLSDKPKAPDVDIAELARGTVGFSGADLFNLVNVAAVQAAMEDLEHVTRGVLDFAKDKILMGAERKSALLTEEGRRLTAFHESGHAIVALRTRGAMPVHKATIMPRGNTLGMVQQLPDKDETSTSYRQMLARLDVCMGGRVAEEMVFGVDEVTSGATSDLRQATRLATHMVAECGMSELVGPMFIRQGGAPGEPGVSAELQKKVDTEVGRLLAEASARVKGLLKDHEKDLHKLATALLEKETMTGDEIEVLLNIGGKGGAAARSLGAGAEGTDGAGDTVVAKPVLA